ncbi:MAG: enolase C-terminal domain-like protein, partial [Mariniphaga sp.]
MKKIRWQIADKNKTQETKEANAVKAEIANPFTSDNRRNFLKKAVFGGVALGGLIGLSIEDTIARTTANVSRTSSPSDLVITDMRYAQTTVLGSTAIIRIDTNQGIYGLGEVRDGADVRYALMLKSRILGLNPCNVEMIFKIIKQFGGPSRQAGGVCGVEMALWDLCGKAYGVPAWQLLGGRYRDKIRLYADTPESDSPEEQLRLIKYRTEEQGYTWLKMDLSIDELKNIPGTLVNQKFWQDSGSLKQWQGNYTSYSNTQHPFTQIQITDKGLDELAKMAEHVRSLVGYDIPISTDHYGHFDLNNGIRLGRALEKYRLAWMEDIVSWELTDQWKTMSDALETP